MITILIRSSGDDHLSTATDHVIFHENHQIMRTSPTWRSRFYRRKTRGITLECQRPKRSRRPLANQLSHMHRPCSYRALVNIPIIYIFHSLLFYFYFIIISFSSLSCISIRALFIVFFFFFL